MSKYIIQPGNKLSGEIKVHGAKNAALKIFPATLLSKQPCTINNVPEIEDVFRVIEILKQLGANVEKTGDHQYSVDPVPANSCELPEELMKKLRASIMFVGPLLVRCGEVKFLHPGGCVIGAGKRPIDLFLAGFKAFGAEIKLEDGWYHIRGHNLQGAKFFFPKISVTGTECLMMTATLIPGKTVLKNCALEPEIPVLAEYLNKCGAKIKGAGTSTIEIEGVKELSADKFDIIPDRIETGTFAILAAATKNDLTITNCNPEHVEALWAMFDRNEIKYELKNDSIKIHGPKSIKSADLTVHEYPGFATDLQPPYTLLMTQAEGNSLIHEPIYDRRIFFIDLLAQMNANIILCDPHRVVVQGPSQLYGRTLVSPDLRAGITLVIAALCAEGQTTIENIYQIERGYESIVNRLQGIGVDIKNVK